MKEDIKERLKEDVLAFIKLPLSRMPLWIEAIGAGVFFSVAVDKNPLFKERLRELDGKIFLFEATDIKKRFHLFIKGGELRVIPHMAVAPDVIMRGELKIFFELFLGKTDPDTVFFSRKLEISGDTSAAIHLKNILASVF